MSEQVVMGWPLGLFTMMAVMVAVIAGSTGIRMLFIDSEYRRIISAMSKNDSNKTPPDLKTPPNESSAKHTDKRQGRKAHAKDLLYMRTKRESNRKDVNLDGFSIFGILAVGVATALGLSPSLHVSAFLAVMVFSHTMRSFYNHAQTVLKRPDDVV